MYNALSKSSPTMGTFAEELSNCCDYFWGFQDFLIYLAKYFWSLLNSPSLSSQQYFTREMQIKQFDFFIKSLKNTKKKLVLTSFYYVSWQIWLGNSKKLICIDQSRLYSLRPATIQKCLTWFQNILAFLTINHLQPESRI